MSTKEKLRLRFIFQPKDFTFEEMTALLTGLGFEISHKGKTSGSRIRFINKLHGVIIDLHKPHPSGIVKEAAMKDVYNKLVTGGFIKAKK